MKKTNKLFEKYFQLFSEQEPGAPNAPAPEAAPPAPPAPPVEPPASKLDENEKYVIKILTNAFIFNPGLFDRNKQRYIFNKVENIKRMVNVPVAKIIDEIKKIINLDNSLRIESKTEHILSKYYMFLEQPKDATEPQTDQPAAESGASTDTSPEATDTPENGSGLKLSLVEIFPLYKELILNSLKHIPTEEELMIIKPIVNEFADSDPEKIVDTIQNIISNATEDKEVQDSLSNV